MAKPEIQSSDSGRVRVGQMDVELISRVSRSETSEVYEIVDLSTGAHLALKCFSDPELALREVAILKRLSGGPVPRLLATGEIDERKALIMEWIEGKALADFPSIAAGRLNAGRKGSILENIARALGKLHQSGVLHRDLKPEHVFVCGDSSVRLIDLSAAMFMDKQTAESDIGLPVTPGVAAPEQISVGEEGPWTDVYGFGAVLYWLLTGKLPANDIGSDPSLGASGSALRLALECLSPDSDGRPQTAEELASRLAGLELPSELPKELDPFPETTRIRTRAPGIIPVVAGPSSDEGRTRHHGRVLWGAVGVLLLSGIAAAASFYLLPLYERHFKVNWVVDSSGGGDAATVAEVLQRGGDVLRIELAAGPHVFAPISGRDILIAPLPGLQSPPRIVAEGGICAELNDTKAEFSGVIFDGEAGAEAADCLVIRGGQLTLSDVQIEKAVSTALVVDRGATVEGRSLEIVASGGDGLHLSGGSSIAIEEMRIEQSGGVGLRATEGADAEISGLRIANTGAAGIAIGSGATVEITGAQIETTVGSGIDVAQGARLTLRDASITGAAGAGLGAYEGTSVVLEDLELRRNALSGLFVDDAYFLTLLNVAISENSENGAVLLGIRDGSFDSVEIRKNKGAGLAIFPDVRLELNETTVTENDGGDILDGRIAAETPAAKTDKSE